MSVRIWIHRIRSGSPINTQSGNVRLLNRFALIDEVVSLGDEDFYRPLRRWGTLGKMAQFKRIKIS
jgi:hypothetical protein